MPSADIPFPVTSSVGGKPQEGGGRLINAIVEKLSDGARATVVRKRAPGMNQVANITGRTNCRGMITVNATTLVAVTDRLVAITPSGTGPFTVTDLGALNGTLPVTFAKNNKTPTPDIVCVTENGPFLVTTTTAPVSYPDPDVGSPNSVSFGDGYFFFTYGDGTVIASDLNSTAINPLDFATAEAKSDTLNRAVFFRQELFLMGSASIEVWQNTANPTGFPFSRSTVIPRGLVSRWAVAGFEDGWANTLVWVGDDNIVYQMQGYAPARISTHDVERAIEAYTTEGNADSLYAFVYMVEGHAYWALKSPTWTWVYDVTTQSWSERRSYERTTWRGQFSARNSGVWLVGDDNTGLVFAMDGAYYNEGNDPLVWQVESGQMADFPTRVVCARADFDFVVAVGDDTGAVPIQTAPTVLIAWSDNGGATFSEPLRRTLGGMGDYKHRITVFRTGLTGPMGRMWKLTVSDPVYVGILGGSMMSDIRNP